MFSISPEPFIDIQAMDVFHLEWEEAEINLVICLNLCIIITFQDIYFILSNAQVPISPFLTSLNQSWLFWSLYLYPCARVLVAQFGLYVHVLQIQLTATLCPILPWWSFIINAKWSNG